jgi:hypothetical protein
MPALVQRTEALHDRTKAFELSRLSNPVQQLLQDDARNQEGPILPDHALEL